MTKDKLLDPMRSAILVIDMQHDFCHPNGVFARRGFDVNPVGAIVPTIGRLIVSARAAGVLVIYTRTETSPETDSPAWLTRPSMIQAAAGGRPVEPVTLRGSWGAELYGVEPRSDEPVVVKCRYSAFLHTTLETILRVRGVDTLYMTGTQTNVCVLYTAVHGLMLNFRPVLVRDATATLSAEAYHRAVCEFENSAGPSLLSDDVLASWSKSETEAPYSTDTFKGKTDAEHGQNTSQPISCMTNLRQLPG